MRCPTIDCVSYIDEDDVMEEKSVMAGGTLDPPRMMTGVTL